MSYGRSFDFAACGGSAQDDGQVAVFGGSAQDDGQVAVFGGSAQDDGDLTTQRQ